MFTPCPYQGGFPSLTLPPAVHIPSGDPPRAPAGAIRAPFSTLVFLFAFRSDMWTAQQTTFSRNFSIFGGPGVDFRRFWVPKQVPAAYFFGVFSKMTILLKLCSHHNGSTILTKSPFLKKHRKSRLRGTVLGPKIVENRRRGNQKSINFMKK